MQEPLATEPTDSSLLPVSVTTSILAVLVALVSLLGHRSHTRTIYAQNQSTGEWVDYASKATGRASYDAFLDFLSVAQLKTPSDAEKVRDKFRHAIEESDREQKEIEVKADVLEHEVIRQETAADRFDFGDVCLEAALVITSITLLTKRRFYWLVGIVLASVGLVIAATGFFV
ncbi:MAG: DUF4337 domain-containing protein [Bryobacteraceae bacterium]